MKILKYTGLTLVSIIALIVILLYIFDYAYILKGVRVVYMTGHSSAFIDDHVYFDNAIVKKANNPLPWPHHKSYNEILPTEKLQETNNKLETVAFLIIKNDSIWFEKYAEGYGTDSQTNSFSMAKSVVSALLFKAIQDGYVENLDQPIGDFIPEFSTGLAAQATIGDFSSMSSGLNWTEHYTSPFSITARAYYEHELDELMKTLEIVDTPGQSYRYLSGNTQILAMAIEKATGKTLYHYLSESFWKPLRMTQDALWQVDSKENDLVKAYCCISSNAHDFARFGQLFKNRGVFNRKQVLDARFIELATTSKFSDSPQYGYGFWLSDYKNKEIFAMRGILGQYVIVIPEDDVIIVRLGHHRGTFINGQPFTADFYTYIDEAYRMMGIK
ncbi:beta-lactamase family protein [Aquimarina sp. ERC-38]|uniref:serine hydrolase domain-containing protein n=1 Tax=Aquimarina sp. ERC-38 TaxID=2949996 RepID=UPI002247CA36|nr:serine hydrolase [Aquimarina sp. ERC-38]UZO82004.1 beta-lactamase family protein [Aquimarina sp. ERC-38]